MRREEKLRIVLGIESSCDETAIALVREDGEILAHALQSQREHLAYGGVVPEIAARAHLAAIDALLAHVLRDANCSLNDVDAVAATTGPGLIGGVIVGTMLGKSLAFALNKPFIAVNHLEAHALMVRQSAAVAFPFLLLLVSGGHCQILCVHGVGNYQLLGQTRDDALGEAFDKCAKMLGLDYPGGPLIEAYATRGNAQAYAFPRPMLGREGCDFSFSGLKTAVRLAIMEASGGISETLRADIAASFQQAVADTVRDRMLHACKQVPGIAQLVVAGGVAANQRIRSVLQEVAAAHGMQMLAAPPALCTDNGVMIAWAGIERLRLGLTDSLATEPRARWPLDHADYSSATNP
jgi:N6-L-threonylcarbamoyladenine synthase